MIPDPRLLNAALLHLKKIIIPPVYHHDRYLLTWALLGLYDQSSIFVNLIQAQYNLAPSTNYCKQCYRLIAVEYYIIQHISIQYKSTELVRRKSAINVHTIDQFKLINAS